MPRRPPPRRQDAPLRQAGGGVLNSAESAQETSWARYKAASAAKKAAASATGRAGAGGIDESAAESSVNVRVAPLLTTTWGQGGAAGLYIPNNYPCGCAPLAGAQVMRYFKWPVTEGTGDDVFTVDTTTVFPTAVDGATYTGDDPQRNLFGHYNWDSMPVYSDNPTVSGADTIGKLVHDVAFSMGTKFASGGSEISVNFLANVWKDYFNYAGARFFQGDTSIALYAPVMFPAYIRTIKSNLDAKLPVVVGINNNGSGSSAHAVVADGYGYTKTDGELYVHFNLGWSGTGDAWYNMTASSVTLDTGSQGFNNIDAIVFNIFTNTYDNTYTIVSGRVTNELDGGVVAGATVTAVYNKTTCTAATDENGIYALMLPTDAPQSTGSNITLIELKARSYTITASKDGWNAVSQTATVARNIAPGENGLNYDPENDLYLNNKADIDFTLCKRFAKPVITTANGTRVFVSGGTTTVTLTTSDVDEVFAEESAVVKLHYTTDGSTPTESSPSVSSGETIEISSDCTLKVLPFATGSIRDNSNSLAEMTFAAVDPADNLIPNGDFELSASTKGGIRAGTANYSNPWWMAPDDNTIVAKPYNGSTWVQAISQYGAKAAILQTSGDRASAQLAHEAFIVPATGIYRFQFDYSARNSTKWGLFSGATTSFTIKDSAGIAVSSGSVTPESASPATYVASVELAAGTYTLVFEQGQYEDPDNAGTYVDKGNVFDNIVLKTAEPAPAPSIALESGAFNFFGDSAKVAITSGTRGAAIYYTIDGTDPTTASAQFTAPFSISSDTTVKAIVVAPGYTASAAATALFKKTAVVGENLVRGATAIGGANPAATTTFTAHSAGSYDVSFTYAGTAGGIAEVVATGADGTAQVVATVTAGEDAQTFNGAIEIAAGGAYTLSLRAQGGGSTDIALGDLAVLIDNSATNAKKFWIVENKTAHNATGSWSPATEYSGGRIMFDDAVAYTASSAASTRYATIKTKMNFLAYNATGDTAAPSADTKAAMRIGDVSGSFELYTMVEGSPVWVAVTAEGVIPAPSTDYSLVFKLDTETKTYTAAVLDTQGKEIPFKNGEQTRFPFACDSATAVQTVTFDCSGSVESIYGSDKLERKGVLIKVK